MTGEVIGIYGGTFDPIHFGHLNLAIEMQEAHQLSEVWFCPAKVSPHKLDTMPATSKQRIKMLHLAISAIPSFRIIDIETTREGPSYTIDTLQALLKQERECANPRELRLLIGNDTVSGFFRWHKCEEIIKLVPLLIGSRSASPFVTELAGDPEICAAIKKGFTPTRIMDISSTEIRQRILQKLYCGHLVPAKVMDYIYAHQLYSGCAKVPF